jgi:hypothetical protein
MNTYLDIVSVWIAGVAAGAVVCVYITRWRDRRRPPPF